MFGFKKRRRAKLRATPFPAPWLETIQRNLPYFNRLSCPDQQRLLGDTLIFLSEKHFEACGGLRLTDEQRVTVAAGACVLTLHRDLDDYDKLDTILIYPETFIAEDQLDLGDGFVIEGEELHEGEQWGRGVIILAWNDIRRDFVRPDDGHHVIFHEFAHQLDPWNLPDDFSAPGIPNSWPPIFQKEFLRLNDTLDRNEDTFLDEYAAENAAEFFAVITEYFFTIPLEFRAAHTELYTTLTDFYSQDPAAFYTTTT